MPPTSSSRSVASSAIRQRLARLTPPADLTDPGVTPATNADPDRADLPPTTPPRRSVRVEPGRSSLLLLCAVAVVAAAVAALLTWSGRPDPAPVPLAAVVVTGSLPAGGADTGPLTSSPAPASPTTVVVAVVGQVVTPGLVTLPLGSRVADAVAAAGGARPDADLSTVNLARVLVDGEQVAVGVPGAPQANGAPPGSGVPALVNLNTATEAELEDLPGVGPVLAGRIAAYRDEQGGFTSIDELQEVSGIGPSTYADLQGAVTV